MGIKNLIIKVENWCYVKYAPSIKKIFEALPLSIQLDMHWMFHFINSEAPRSISLNLYFFILHCSFSLYMPKWFHILLVKMARRISHWKRVPCSHRSIFTRRCITEKWDPVRVVDANGVNLHTGTWVLKYNTRVCDNCNSSRYTSITCKYTDMLDELNLIGDTFKFYGQIEQVFHEALEKKYPPTKGEEIKL